jgi:anhydro-N-acetylmuramic acid kinase
MKTTYSVIGAMAGSSMDGIDLAHVCFEWTNNEWGYQLKKCETIPYTKNLHDELSQSSALSINQQQELDQHFGVWIGDKINAFKSDIGSVDLLGIHGHTVIHEPHNKISWQLGAGTAIASNTAITTVTDFRSLDIEHGGQGAPLVPFGDFLLFKDYDACLNLGGIANVSIKNDRTAWDICPCNQVLNFFSKKLGQPYDKGGELARQGSLDESFYTLISSMDYFLAQPPKSLPNNFIDHFILDSVDPLNGLHTYVHIIADEIAKNLPTTKKAKLLATGGGAWNSFLIELLSMRLKGWSVHVPDEKTVAFKEAIVFAFLALKRFENEVNVLASVTGASKDTSSGVIHLP